MIRLTVNAKSEPEIHLFNKSPIIIGNESGVADIPLLGLDLQPIHLQIIEQNSFLIIVNIANDPFISLNGHPFGKKLLNNGDVILVHQIEILFESLNEAVIEKSQPDPLVSLLNNKIKAQELAIQQKVAIESSLTEKQTTPSFFDLQLAFEKDVEALPEGEWQNSELDHYLKELEHPQVQSESKVSSNASDAANESQKVTSSLKDDYLKEWEDDHQNLPLGLQPTEQNHLYQAWKWIIFFIFSIFTIAAIAGTAIYLTLSDKTEAQEFKVAQGMADIAIALTHAQLNHLKPHNQNWSDIDFIKTHLQTILPNIHSYAFDIDTQGQFNCCAYSLRIYTDNDLSHFLIIAQPAPSLLHWLVPKSAVLVDSQAMELRTLKDLRNLNRLLANPDPLEGINGKEIHALLKEGELIQLSSLAKERKGTDFVPPKNLGWIKPGSDNLIYNAPRYYRLTQALVQKAAALGTLKGTSQEVTALKQDIESFSRLNHLVLYTDQGKESAAFIKQSIDTFAPSDKVLFGYLMMNPQDKIFHAYLLKEEEEVKVPSSNLMAYSTPHSEIGEMDQTLALQTFHDKKIKEEPFSQQTDPHKQTDLNHPIYIQLQALAHTRENELRSCVQALHDLLNQEISTPSPHFQTQFQNLSDQYLATHTKHQEKIKETLKELYHRYEEMPAAQFISFLTQFGFDHLIEQETPSFVLPDKQRLENFENLLIQLENAQTLQELNHLTHTACSWLTLDYVKNPQELIHDQNLLRNQVLSRLEALLISHQTDRELPYLKKEEREPLMQLLNDERLIQADEKEFFLKEFDLLINQEPDDLNEAIDNQEEAFNL